MFDNKYKMKAKTIVLVLSGLVAGCLAVSAQDNSTAANPATTDTAAPAAIVVAQADPAPAAPPAESAPAATPAAEVVKPPAAVSASPQVIPLIVMDDVPLTDAIKNLARQANLNYMLDPKITFGQPGPDGKPAPQPSVSIRWENITAGQALVALLNNYSLQLVEDPKTKIARVTPQDPAAPPVLLTKIIKLNYASPSNIVSAVQSSLTDKRSRVIADVRSSQLVMVGTEKELVEANNLIERLDSPTKQVLIEARIMETSLNPKSVKGIDWSGTLGHQQVTLGNNALPGTAPTPAGTALDANGNPTPIPGTPGTIGGILSGVGSGAGVLANLSKGSVFNPATAFLNADGVSAVLSFLNSEQDANVIATPRAVTLDNETAMLEVVDQVPVVNVTAGTANTTGGSSVGYTNVGVKLKVTPRISANNFVNLIVIPEVSSHVGDQAFSAGGSQISVPIFNRRTIETAVMIPSGNTLVLGGLVQDQIQKSYTKVPFLGDIPWLGYAFRHESKDRRKMNLLIFITPTIVKDSDYQADNGNFLQTPVTDIAAANWSEWDNGKPHDWSKVESKKATDSGKK